MIDMANDRDLALAAALRQIADAMVMSAATRAGVPPGIAATLPPAVEAGSVRAAPKVKRKVSAYSRAYGAAYRRLRKKATLKSGKLRKGVTHKKLVKQAHAEAKRITNGRKRR